MTVVIKNNPSDVIISFFPISFSWFFLGLRYQALNIDEIEVEI
jgi:hypothetical protein